MQEEPGIFIKNATLGYESSQASAKILTNVNLQFFSGELVGIIGLNGVGKSTLLKSICGLQPSLEGYIYIRGRNIREISLSEIARLVSVVLTDKVAGFNLTTFDLVAAGQMPYTNSFHQLTDKNHRIINQALEICGIEEYKGKLLHELSDGLFQKASIARAIAQQTPVMLLDEPTAFLDFASKHKLFLLLRELTREGKTILVSSHDLDLVSRYCDKVLIVDGHSQTLLKVTELAEHPAFKKITGGYL
ncbi:MAG: ABC transporter ATP-binding protein [Bacteroidia bacterium]|nr:ABC transporter ATP-binding protein [Bacteroidia bacterium]